MDRYIAQVKPPGNIKKPESIDKWMFENAEERAAEDYCKTGLSGLHGEICAIGFAFDGGDPVSLVRTHDTTEYALIHEFANQLADQRLQGEGGHQNIEWIGHNVLDFDLRFLKQRCLVNRIPLGVRIPADARHGQNVFDTMKEWAGFRGFVKQDELCEVFGLPTKSGMDGKDVWPAWQAGKFKEIREYNKHDVETVTALYDIMTGGF